MGVSRSALLSFLIVGCGASPVARIVDGTVVSGRFIGDDAYGDFLLGALAEENGDFAGALTHYLRASEADANNDPELWTRIASLRCRRDPTDPRVDASLARAFHGQRDYPGAVDVQKRCATRRPSQPGAYDEGKEAPTLSDLVIRETGAGAGAGEAELQRRVALSLLERERVDSWVSLAVWGLAHGDPTAAVRGLAGLASAAPRRRLALGQWAKDLAGKGHLVGARMLAAALLDAEGDRSSGGTSGAVASIPEVARLALDEAILRHDVTSIYSRSARAHLGIEVAAARAWALGDPALARELIAATSRADPSNLSARLVHDGAAGRASSRLVVGAHDLSADVALPLARDLVTTEGTGAAKRVLHACGPELAPAGDAVLVPIAVELAIAGVIDEAKLPADARIELAARRGIAPDPSWVADSTTDLRHRLLALALVQPTDAGTVALAERLAPSVSEDRLVAIAVARIALAKREAVPSAARARVESASASDPLAAATLVLVASTDASPAALVHARRDLAALAKTRFEQARASE